MQKRFYYKEMGLRMGIGYTFAYMLGPMIAQKLGVDMFVKPETEEKEQVLASTTNNSIEEIVRMNKERAKYFPGKIRDV